MNRPTILIHDISQGDAIEREMTESEYQQFLKDQEMLRNEYKKQEAKRKMRENALGKLIDLGLTEDEIASLL